MSRIVVVIQGAASYLPFLNMKLHMKKEVSLPNPVLIYHRHKPIDSINLLDW
jgi:hypothetical protein